MPKGPMSEEHKAKIREGVARAKAEKEAQMEEQGETVEVAPTEPVVIEPIPDPEPEPEPAPIVAALVEEKPAKKQLINLHLASRTRVQGAFRSIKYVKPECRIGVLQSNGPDEYTTGPCQQQAAKEPALRYSWFKNCPHDPYYEVAERETRIPVVDAEGYVIEDKRRRQIIRQLRIREVVVNTKNAQDRVEEVKILGGKDPAEFNLLPFCNFMGCFQQTTRRYDNGRFCSEQHATLVKATENKVFLPVNWGNDVQNEKNDEKRETLMRENRASLVG